MPKDKAAIPSVARIYGVQAHSLEKWLHYRELFNQDKTALKLSIFGENALRKIALEDRSILQLEKNSRFKPYVMKIKISIFIFMKKKLLPILLELNPFLWIFQASKTTSRTFPYSANVRKPNARSHNGREGHGVLHVIAQRA